MELVIIQVEDGKFDLSPLKRYFSCHYDGSYRCEITRIRKKRSLDQNGWLWGCIYPLLLKGLIDAGWEFTDCAQVHEIFKSLLAKQSFVNKHTGEIVELPRSTAEMDTVTFCEYCEQLRHYGMEYLGIDIPDPNKLWRVEDEISN